MFGIWSEREGIEVKPSCLRIQSFESVSNSNVDPYSDVIWSYVQGTMIERDCLISSTKMSKCGSDLVHQQVIRRLEGQCTIKKINRDLIFPFNKEKNG